MHNGCILVGGVGSGKSRTALAYFYTKECGGRLSREKGVDDSPMKRPKPLYIITTARKRDSLDWEQEAVYFGLSRDRALSSVEFVVDSWNKLHKYTEVENGFFIFDEQRVVGSGVWVKSFLKIAKRNRWILLSATPGDTWMDYIPVFVANGFYRNRTEFLREHVVFARFSKYPRVERYTGVGKLAKLKSQVLVYMPFARSTVSHVEKVKCGFDKHAFLRVYRGRWNIFDSRPVAQAGEWVYLLRRVVNEDRSRLEAVLDLFERHKRLIVFYNFDYELETLRDGFSEYFLGREGAVLAEYNGHRHEQVPSEPNWVYLVQYTAGSEAWNCISTNAIAFYSLNYSYKVMEQASGRINRMNTPYIDLYYYILYSESTIDRSILTALKNKRSFNEHRFYQKALPKEENIRKSS